MKTIKRKIEDISPVLIIQYKNFTDRFLSLEITGKILISLIAIFYLSLISWLLVVSNESNALIFSIFFTTLIMFIFVLPRQAKSFQYKVAFGKDLFMLFNYSNHQTFCLPLPYTYLKSYSFKKKILILELNKDLLEQDVSSYNPNSNLETNTKNLDQESQIEIFEEAHGPIEQKIGYINRPNYRIGNLTDNEINQSREILKKTKAVEINKF